MKFALCFSGQPRFINQCFPFIRDNLLSNLKNYDIYAYFQWDKNWKSQPIHHEHKDTFKINEIEEFKKCYSEHNLKELKVVDPIIFDTDYYDKGSIESDLFLTKEQAKVILYRLKAQYQCVSDCVSLIPKNKKYDYIVRLRTDNIFNSPIRENDLAVNSVTTQDGFCAGYDRPHCDWFIVSPFNQKEFFHDMGNVDKHLENGIVHMHKLIYNIGQKYNIAHKQFFVDIPSTTKKLKLYYE
jgi:hypothetical protein